MTGSLQKTLKNSVRSGSTIPCVIVDVFYGRVSVRLSGNGQVLHNLPVVGSPIVVGGGASLDMSTPIPSVYVGSYDTTTVVSAQGYDPGSSQGVGSRFEWNIALFDSTGFAKSFPSTDAGLTDALKATSGIVIIPPSTFSGTFTVNGGCALIGFDRDVCVINGSLVAKGSIADLSISNIASSSSDINAMTTEADADDISIVNCSITCKNNGSGRGFGIVLAGSRIHNILGCHTYGDAATGAGYGAWITNQMAGNTFFRGGYLGGKTFPYLRG